METARPPGHTCLGIDRARTLIRAVGREAANGADPAKLESALSEALEALEEVRAENMQMREAFIDASAMRHIATEAVALVRGGYDGPMVGDPVEPLFRAVVSWEARKRRGGPFGR